MDPAGIPILLVDDEDTVRTTIRRVLERAGYRVHAADGTAAAIAIWQEEQLQLGALITDVILGEDNGIQLAARFRRDRPDLPVVIVSGYTGSELARTTELPPDVHFLQKPFTMPELIATVRAALERPRPA